MSKSPSQPQMSLLLVEDNPGDVRLVKEALKEISFPLQVTVVPDGIEAMAAIRCEGRFADSPRPDLVVLDLNLPRKDGREVLAEVKQDSELRRIPVVVLTTSLAAEDIRLVYDLHANCYVAKPLDLDLYLDVIRAIQSFWFRTVRLPRESHQE